MTQQLDLLGICLDEASTRRLALPQQRAVRRPRMQPLVDVPRAANADPETSHLAAEQIKASGALGKQQQRVLDAVRCYPGRTSAELASLIAAERKDDYSTWRTRTGRRLPELRGVHIRMGESRVCQATKRECVTWWPL